ncbi:hypothetical protein EPI10_019889 [Gossypium australe]|uniref:Uncharacterized protein n=1 Tax=Gossypium australe TaxID=47621 RepID=A0A5B6WDH1_9ROSI|nr:hypothetical protein EPI10_019889 [Gossypium australe]
MQDRSCHGAASGRGIFGAACRRGFTSVLSYFCKVLVGSWDQKKSGYSKFQKVLLMFNVAIKSCTLLFKDLVAFVYVVVTSPSDSE